MIGKKVKLKYSTGSPTMVVDSVSTVTLNCTCVWFDAEGIFQSINVAETSLETKE
jgi:uncharacterized protein YodC (DUF2158 family)